MSEIRSDPACSRRKALAATGTALTVGLAGCTGLLGGKSKLQQQIDTVREATKQYTDPKTALKDGFKPGGPYVPGMGWHFQHPQRLKSAAKKGFDLEKPPILTYLETDSGLKLGAAEFAAPAPAVPSSPDLFADEKAQKDVTEKWGVHAAATHVFATGDGSKQAPKNISFSQWTERGNWSEFRPPNRKLKPGDTISLNWGSPKGKQGERTKRVIDFVTTHPDLKALHVWAHAKNPNGVFAAMNPKFRKGN